MPHRLKPVPPTKQRWHRLQPVLVLDFFHSFLSPHFLPLGPVSFSGLHNQPFPSGRQLDRPPFGNSDWLGRHVTNAVLAAQIILNGVENLIDALFLRNLKKTCPRVPRNTPVFAAACRTAQRNKPV